ncbi:mechanosensitive ion channel family protein [Geminocystis sp.]|uniref:mechanosensitive ion channel family protein n=1 Tax=Geminocystis sp. TaxID=2664100 RepID=UPI0035949064
MIFTKQKIISYLLVFLFTLFVVLPVKAQIPFFPAPETLDAFPETPTWDLNKAEPCGRFLCSSVFFFSDLDFRRERIIVALPRDITKSTREVALEVEQRARFIQTVFRGIFNNMRTFIINNPVEERKNRNFWLITNEKPLHPATPIVEVGIENSQTVIYVTLNPKIGLVQQAILTVTEADARANTTTISQLAQTWRNKIRESFSNALWGLEMDIQRPFLRINVPITIIIITFSLITFIRILKKILKKWHRNLQKEFHEIYETLKVNPEENFSQNTTSKEVKSQSYQKTSKNLNLIQKIFTRGVNDTKEVIQESLSFSAKLFLVDFNQRRNFIKQKMNLIELISNLLFLNQITLILFCVAVILVTFRDTRFLFNLFFTQSILLPLIWIAMVLTDKIIDFWIDNLLDDWAKAKQEINPNSNRPILRVNTYSPALRGATTIFFNVIGIFLTLAVIGISPSILASAGALAVVFAFLSRNLFDDMLNGILILTTDRYALGDVIEINGFMGCVETMNLYITALRNLDGQLIIIPNGKISTVVNMTKNWSQVNFTIEVAWNSELQKTMNILQEVADQMYQEKDWKDKMITSADILGIEKIAHDGITIRLIIKTQPSEQWRVGREYRWRVKKAFDKAGISLGIPQTVIWHKDN